MKSILLIVTIVMLITATGTYGQKAQSSFQTNTYISFTYEITDMPDYTYGYDVYDDNKLLIHQTCIPATPGNCGFATKKDAAKVAELVIEKMKKGIMPLTITKEELQKLKVIP